MATETNGQTRGAILMLTAKDDILATLQWPLQIIHTLDI